MATKGFAPHIQNSSGIYIGIVFQHFYLYLHFSGFFAQNSGSGKVFPSVKVKKIKEAQKNVEKFTYFFSSRFSTRSPYFLVVSCLHSYSFRK